MVTWTKLKSGEWGLRATEALVEGAVVVVTRANGSRSNAEVGRLVWAGNGVFLYTQAKAGVAVPVAPKPVLPPAKAAAELVTDWDVDDMFDDAAAEIAAERAAEDAAERAAEAWFTSNYGG